MSKLQILVYICLCNQKSMGTAGSLLSVGLLPHFLLVYWYTKCSIATENCQDFFKKFFFTEDCCLVPHLDLIQKLSRKFHCTLQNLSAMDQHFGEKDNWFFQSCWCNSFWCVSSVFWHTPLGHCGFQYSLAYNESQRRGIFSLNVDF